MSKQGQIVIPAEIRNRFKLGRGDIFRVGGHNGVVVIQKIEKMTDQEAARLAKRSKRPIKLRITVNKADPAPDPAGAPQE